MSEFKDIDTILHLSDIIRRLKNTVEKDVEIISNRDLHINQLHEDLSTLKQKNFTQHSEIGNLKDEIKTLQYNLGDANEEIKKLEKN